VRPLRILWLQWRDIKHPWSGGAEVYMHEVSRRLAREGFRVHVATSWFPGLKPLEKIDGYTVERVGTHDNYILYVPHFLKRYSSWANVIIEDTSKAPLMTPLLRPKKHIPVLAVVHHLNREIYFYETSLLKALIAYLLESHMTRLYTHLPNTILITISKSTKQELVKLGADPKKIIIAPNAINNTISADPSLQLKSLEPSVIYLSRIKKYKQPYHALLAFKIILKHVPKAKLIIAGKGTNILLKYIKRLGIEHAVEVHGEVDEETKMKLLRRAWILIQTSMKEGFGITVLEAATCKTPTIAYNVPGLRDSVKHMETGVLVEPRNIEQLAKTITHLLSDHESRNRLAENAYRHAQQYSWDKTAKTFLKTIEGFIYG